MQIGRLRHRIILEESRITRDSFGAEIFEWVQVSEIWADVTPLSGKEFVAFKQINAEISSKVTLRYQSGIDTKMRVLFNDRIFEILSIINQDEKNIALVLMCKEVV
jgi:SPP1 family predicted phage head-tail adaptor